MMKRRIVEATEQRRRQKGLKTARESAERKSSQQHSSTHMHHNGLAAVDERFLQSAHLGMKVRDLGLCVPTPCPLLSLLSAWASGIVERSSATGLLNTYPIWYLNCVTALSLHF